MLDIFTTVVNDEISVDHIPQIFEIDIDCDRLTAEKLQSISLDYAEAKAIAEAIMAILAEVEEV